MDGDVGPSIGRMKGTFLFISHPQHMIINVFTSLMSYLPTHDELLFEQARVKVLRTSFKPQRSEKGIMSISVASGGA